MRGSIGLSGVRCVCVVCYGVHMYVVCSVYWYVNMCVCLCGVSFRAVYCVWCVYVCTYVWCGYVLCVYVVYMVCVMCIYSVMWYGVCVVCVIFPDQINNSVY